MIVGERTRRAMDEVMKDRFTMVLSKRVREISGARGAALDGQEHYEATRAAVDHAFACGFTTKGAVTIYVDAARILGGEFWCDPRYDWAVPYLTVQAENDDPNLRASKLKSHMESYLDEVFEPDRSALLAFVHNLCGDTELELHRQDLSNTKGLLLFIEAQAPQICGAIGRDICRRYIDASLAYYEKAYPNAAPRDLCLLVVLSFGFGIGFHRDPYLVWLTKPLGNDQLTLNKKIAAMEARARAWIKALVDGSDNND